MFKNFKHIFFGGGGGRGGSAVALVEWLTGDQEATGSSQSPASLHCGL